MAVRVIVNGVNGKMGSLAKVTIEGSPEFELVAGLSKQDNLRQAITDTRAEIVIDLTRADSVYANTLTIIESGAHPVIGTSGLLSQQIKQLTTLSQSKQLGGIIAPNFSIAAVLMMRFASLAAAYLPDVEIIEAHHPQKQDAPSGTAMKTAEMIAKARGRDVPQQENTHHELLAGARGADCRGIQIHSLRLPGVLARQHVIFGSSGETLTITHDSIDRACFMPGIIRCCQKVLQLKTLHYGLDTILD
ncbi:MAG: 4-hydroxy-tetrahydrodipicolinate reductase [Legionellales bacterium RIFCSPHIGHO2_12_FULL_42_9]|nr:MAG: 4-hydroxy-tetrahydrodipicolinate reductase [Legionellales bacterium RIFCSPHIGHO2_12_FULL_42_9]